MWEAVSLSSAAADVFVYFGRRLHTVHANEAANRPTRNKELKANTVALCDLNDQKNK